MIRLNANGKRLDAWLIYRCTVCENTWNRAILERQPVGTLAPSLIVSLQANDPALVRRLSFDIAALRRESARIEVFAEVEVRKDVIAEPALVHRRLELRLMATEPLGLRLDRLLAAELRLPRSQVQDLAETGRLQIPSEGARALRRPARDGMRVLIDLASSTDDDAIVVAACGRTSPRSRSLCP